MIYRTSGGATPATAISLFIASALSSLGLPSKILLHHIGGSNGREPLWSGGYTSQKKYQTWPITTPIISSFGMVPCRIRLNPINTHGRYGAVKTSNPKKLNRVSGFRLDQMYTSVDDNGCPRKGIDTRGDRHMRQVMAYISNHEKWAGDRPDDSSSSREYRVKKNTWNTKSRESGPKYRNVVRRRQY
jgi:hypothetical protein